MKRIPFGAWAALVLVALGLAGYFGFHALFVKVGRSIEQPLTGPAKSNPYYVFQRYLEERGLPVRIVRNWPQPLPKDTLVIWFSADDAPADLKAWVSAGGQLWSSRDPDLTGPAGYAWQPTPFAGDEFPDDLEGEAEEPREETADPPEEEAGDEEADPAWNCEEEACLFAAQFRYGAGHLTLVDDEALQNEVVALGQTPARIDGLLHVRALPSSVLFVAQLGSPWFGTLLFAHAPELLLALLTLLVLTLWRAGVHFGRRLPPEPRARRRMLEHVRAVGMLASRVGLEPLLASARRELHRQVQLRVPHGVGLAGDTFAQAVASAMNLPPSEVQRALLEPFHGDRQQAIAIARAMQALWRKT